MPYPPSHRTDAYGRPAPAEVPLDKHGRLATEIQCVGCGYVVRGLAPDDTCPECGAEVAESLKDNRLRLADPAWLSHVRGGLRLIFWLTLANLLVQYFNRVILPELYSSESYWTAWDIGLHLGTQAGLWVLPTGLYAMGVWWVSQPDPDGVESGSLRRLARATSLMLFIHAIVGLGLFSYTMPQQQSLGPSTRLGLLVIRLSLDIVLWYALTGIFARHARRTDRPRSSRQFTILRWLGIAASSTALIGGSIAYYVLICINAQPGSASGYLQWVHFADAVVSLARAVHSVFAIWLLIVLGLLGRRFTHALRQALGSESTT